MAASKGEIVFNGHFEVYPVPLTNPGDWYFGFVSKGTGKVYAWLPDPTGTGNVQPGGAATFTAVNPETGVTESFTAADIVVFQAATAYAQEPAELVDNARPAGGG